KAPPSATSPTSSSRWASSPTAPPSAKTSPASSPPPSATRAREGKANAPPIGTPHVLEPFNLNQRLVSIKLLQAELIPPTETLLLPNGPCRKRSSADKFEFIQITGNPDVFLAPAVSQRAARRTQEPCPTASISARR